ncbi:MAG: hypothetical protein ACFCUO_08390 [Rhodospirillales bacterium]
MGVRESWVSSTTARRLSVMVVVVAGVGAARPASADDFAPRCWNAAPGVDAAADIEFDSATMRATWQNDPVFAPDGTLIKRGWVTVAPLGTEGSILMDQASECFECSPAPMSLTLGGPEFLSVDGQNFLYFSSLSEDETTVRLAKLSEQPSGEWALSFLPESDGKVMFVPGVDSSDAGVKVFYRTVTGSYATGFQRVDWGWRVDDPLFVEDVTMDPRPFVKKAGYWGNAGDFSGRILPDGSKLAHRALQYRTLLDLLLGRPRLVPAIYDFETNQTRPLLDNPRDQTELVEATWPTAFEAPELDGDPVILAVAKIRPQMTNEVVAWRQDATGKWVEWSRIAPVDPDYPCFWNPQGFVVDGRSYVSVSAFQPLACYFGFTIPTPSIVWIASLDPDLPEDERVRRIVSAEAVPGRVSFKTDNEAAVINGNDARVYYIDLPTPLDLVLGTPSVLTVCETGLKR